MIQIEDYAGVAFRGFIEGFYGGGIMHPVRV